MKITRLLLAAWLTAWLAAWCVPGLFCCPAHAETPHGINGEASYISFQVPGGLGTYPMSINNAMTVTGYYYVTPTRTRGFVRTADGTVTTFDVMAGVLTEPASINAVGNITGWYAGVAGVPQGFLRYADGRILTFDPPATGGFPGEAQPVSINDFDDIVGSYPFFARPAVFVRSAAAVYHLDISFARVTFATAINASGSVVGYSNDGLGPYNSGFVVHPDGFAAVVTVPVPNVIPALHCTPETFPDGINAAGMIAGWYVTYTNNCRTTNLGGFVMSPEGVFALFQVPGMLLTSPADAPVPHAISIDQAGDVTGSYTDTAGVQHGFVRNPYGTLTTFDPPEGRQTTATSINDGGAVAGFYQYKAGGSPAGFIRVAF